MPEEIGQRSLLPVILASDNFPSSPLNDPYPSFNPTNGEHFTPFHLTFQDYHNHLPPVGLLRPSMLSALLEDDRDPQTCPWQFHSNAVPGEDEDLELSIKCVFFADWVVKGGKELMSKVMQDTAEKWRDEGKFEGQLKGWRNEKYNIYASPKSSGLQITQGAFSNIAFSIERAASILFGFGTYGVHLTAYEGHGDNLKIWVPRRSRTKPTYPGMLDNSVAGGIPHDLKPLEAAIKECDEEANLPDAFVRPRIRNVGIVTYLHVSKSQWVRPECEYIYDLPLPEQSSAEYIKPQPHDDEVESFALWTIPQVIEALHAGEFKPNSGMIIVDFLIRHGYVTPENEPNYMEISWRLHRRLHVAVPSL